MVPMSELIYKSRSHSKTIKLVNELLRQVDFYKREGLKEVHIVINKGTSGEYHLNFIIDTLERSGYKVEVSEGKLIYNLYVS
jgi:hypothetical protein